MAVEERPIRVRIDEPEDPVRGPARVGRRGVLAVVALLAVTVVAAQSCQQSQVRFSKEAAIATARGRRPASRPSARRCGSCARA